MGITTRTEYVFQNLVAEFFFYRRADINAKIRMLRKTVGDEHYSIASEIRDMFASYGIFTNSNRDATYYEELLNESDLSDYDLEILVIQKLFQLFKQYPSADEFMEQIVNRCSPANVNNQDLSLRLRILKRFYGDGNCLNDVGYGGIDVIRHYIHNNMVLDEGIFDCLEQANSAQKKPSGMYGIIRVANDLAKGIFRASESSKQDIYFFAVVFGMKSVMDIEQIFEDYYVNNCLRFVNPQTLNGGNHDELMTEQGINFKNYGEVILLYVISQNNMTPLEKLALYKQIKGDVEKAQKTQQIISKDTKNKKKQKINTELPASGLMNFDFRVLKYNVEQFEKFLLQHYDCKVPRGKGIMQVHNEQRTAAQKYSEMLGIFKKLALEYSENTIRATCNELQVRHNKLCQAVNNAFAMLLNNDVPVVAANAVGYARNFVAPLIDRYTLRERKNLLRGELRVLEDNKLIGKLLAQKPIFADFQKVVNNSTILYAEDVQKLSDLNFFLNFKYGLANFLDIQLKEWGYNADATEAQEFIRVIEAVDDWLKDDSIWDDKKDVKDKINRTKFLALMFYFYNFREITATRKNDYQNFVEHYFAFTNYANSWLESALYRPIKTNSLLDMLILAASYVYVHKDGVIDCNERGNLS